MGREDRKEGSSGAREQKCMFALKPVRLPGVLTPWPPPPACHSCNAQGKEGRKKEQKHTLRGFSYDRSNTSPSDSQAESSLLTTSSSPLLSGKRARAGARNGTTAHTTDTQINAFVQSLQLPGNQGLCPSPVACHFCSSNTGKTRYNHSPHVPGVHASSDSLRARSVYDIQAVWRGTSSQFEA